MAGRHLYSITEKNILLMPDMKKLIHFDNHSKLWISESKLNPYVVDLSFEKCFSHSKSLATYGLFLLFYYPSLLWIFLRSSSSCFPVDYQMSYFVWYCTCLKYKWLLFRKFNISVHTNDLDIYEKVFWNILKYQNS